MQTDLRLIQQNDGVRIHLRCLDDVREQQQDVLLARTQVGEQQVAIVLAEMAFVVLAQCQGVNFQMELLEFSDVFCRVCAQGDHCVAFMRHSFAFGM
ncbi:hypothetical protein D9M73_227850 [compost metagenome]